MLKSINIFPASDGEHSHLFWLAVPLLLLWLTTSYLLGTFTDKPLWQKSASSTGTVSKIIPYVQKFEELPQNKSGYITFWFDDAWLSQYLVAFPLLSDQGFPGAVAVPTASIETKSYMNWAQLQALQKAGWEITNHSVSHNCNMQTWSADQIAAEYQTSRLELWKHQLASDIFVTPCGVDSTEMRQQAAKIFFAYRTVDSGFNDPVHPNLFNLKIKNLDNQVTISDIKGWIDQAKSTNQWLILVFHQVGEKSPATNADQYNVAPALFSEIIDYVKTAGIQVVIPGQVISAATP